MHMFHLYKVCGGINQGSKAWNSKINYLQGLGANQSNHWGTIRLSHAVAYCSVTNAFWVLLSAFDLTAHQTPFNFNVTSTSPTRAATDWDAREKKNKKTCYGQIDLGSVFSRVSLERWHERAKLRHEHECSLRRSVVSASPWMSSAYTSASQK